MKPEKRELSLLKRTTVLCLAFGIAGVATAIFAGSQSMMFDGLYSFIQSFFIMASASIVRLISRRDDDQYHFGYGSFEPFLIVLRTTFMLAMNIALAVRAATSIINGGYMIELSLGIVFTGISAVVCAVVWRILTREARALHSALLKAEARSWLNDTLISVAVLAAFLVMSILQRIGLTALVPYIDPAMTVVFIGALTPTLVTQLLESLRELLIAAPPLRVQKKLEALVEPFVRENDFAGSDMYASKRGRSIYMVTYVFLRKEEPVVKLDRIRTSMIMAIRKVYPWSDIDIVFTLNPDIADISSPGLVSELS